MTLYALYGSKKTFANFANFACKKNKLINDIRILKRKFKYQSQHNYLISVIHSIDKNQIKNPNILS